MILYDIVCSSGHGFEAWFRDSAAYDRQAAARQVICPVCGITDVRKAPMAPRIARSRAAREGEAGEADDSARSAAHGLRRALEMLGAHIAENSEDVGSRFAEEVRKIHYGEAPHRNLIGDPSRDEAAGLAEEGIEIAPVLVPRRSDA